MNILIVDDHPIVRQGIRHLLSAQIDHARVTEAGSTAEALRKAGEVAPDVCVIDLSLGKESGLDLLRMLREAGFDSPTLVLSVFDESLHAERALRAGALEESNIDLTAELVNMMTAQRTYQANAQTIKTQDQVLSTLTQLR